MLAFVVVLQVVVALFLIMVVLLQPGNRGGASAALGGAGSDTVFGARGANTFLSKLTFGAAVGFMITNLLLSFMVSTGQDKSVLDALESTVPLKKAETPGAKENAVPATGGEATAPAPDVVAPAEEKPAEQPTKEP